MEGLGVGRVVYYAVDRETSFAAIVTNVLDKETGLVNLTVFRDLPTEQGAIFRAMSRTFNESREPGTWHWPPRD